jgi:steroid delta-isomerase-like uncharacterized protein
MPVRRGYEEGGATLSEENKTIVTRLIEEVFNEHDPDSVERFFAPDFVEHVPAPGQGQGSEGMRRFLAEVVFPAFPDMRWTIDEQLAEGDKVLTRFTWRGTHRGAFAGVPPTNEQVEVWGMVLDRISGGKLVESRILMDNVSMLQQLGAIPEPGQSEEASPT